MRKNLFLVVLLALLPLVLIGAKGCENAAPPPGASGHIAGTITAFDKDHLDLKADNGKTVSVKLGPETRYVVGDDKATAADLAIGRRCMVRFAPDKSAAGVYLEAPEKKPGS